MLLLKFLQTLFKALSSDGTPGQVAAGMALGLALGLTPIASLHNALVLAIAMLTTVSFPGFTLGWAIAVPFGFALDPLFHRVGMAMLLRDDLAPFFTWVVNTPIVAWSRLNNSIVLGSLVCWLVVAIPAFFAFRVGVARYRERVHAHLVRLKVVQAVKASKLWNVIQLFVP